MPLTAANASVRSAPHKSTMIRLRITAQKLPGRSWMRLRIIRRIKPDVVFSKGGFVSVPVVYGAHFNRVPIVTHESDLTPGLANKLCLPFAAAQCCTFPEAVKYARGKGVYTGSPIRE